MTGVPYLVRLGQRLRDGLVDLAPERAERHRDFILTHQMPDGGFRGREGDSDLYYTSFAVRSLMMLRQMRVADAERIANFLRQFEWRRLNVIDLMNWFATALAVHISAGIDLLEGEPENWPDEAAALLEAVRVHDGGYAKSVEGASGSTYHSFLVMLTYQLIGQSLPGSNALIQFVYDRQRDDGGFVEISPMRRSGTNPTAAAAAILQEWGAVDQETRDDVRAFLNDVRGSEGGFQANSRVPFCDSLSTFTAVLTCQDLELQGVYNPEQIRVWLTSELEFPTGGFRAAAWDDAADVEYSFYGLGLLALLNASTIAESDTSI